MVVPGTETGLVAALPTLLADLGDLLGTLVPIIFVIFWVISQVRGAARAAKGRELRGPENAAADGTPEPPQEQEFSDKIQDFLQKVQQQADRQTVAGKEQTPEVLEAEIVDPVDVEVATVISPPQAAHGWDQTDEFQSTATLQDRLPRTVMPTVNPQMEQPQQEVFDHQIGNLSQTPRDADSQSFPEKDPKESLGDEEPVIELPTTAEEIRAMLESPEDIRKAVILSEVFSRPHDRW